MLINLSKTASKSLFGYIPMCISVRQLNSNTSVITKTHRETFARVYPTALVLPNGASITIRYHEPRKIITLPLDLSTVSEEVRKERLDRRKPKKKVKIQEDIRDNYNAKKYIKYVKK